MEGEEEHSSSLNSTPSFLTPPTLKKAKKTSPAAATSSSKGTKLKVAQVGRGKLEALIGEVLGEEEENGTLSISR